MAGRTRLSATAEQIAGLRDLARSDVRGEADRARAILLTLSGWTSLQLAEAFGVNGGVVSRRWWKFADGASGGVTVSVQAARSITRLAIGWPMVCHPSTLRRV
ncbi:MAG TPA: hypothetical protein VGN83_02630, partial [Falsiroseomonas sp.]|nr:hypothetical protein [Falsiroseomonas sp.]